MYGCDCHVGCLSGSLLRYGDWLKGSILRHGDYLKGSLLRNGDGLIGNLTMVCSVNKDAYLRVIPDVVWLTPDMIGGEFDIYSNTTWEID